MKFYKCKHCGQIIAKVKDTKVPIICCGEPMQEIVAKEFEEGFNEKHVPKVTISDNHVLVEVGSITHPMTVEHHIEWIALETDKGNQRKVLEPTGLPKAEFMILEGEKVLNVYAYCNLHSLWKIDLSK